jgi:hypothetical protein
MSPVEILTDDPHLLHGPLLRGVFRHPEVHHPASLLR